MAHEPRYAALGVRHLPDIVSRYGLDPVVADALALNAMVLPFRTNAYVLDHLIDWSSPTDDPAFRLVFPIAGALDAADAARLRAARASGDAEAVAETVASIRQRLNPHPSGQVEQNVPSLDGRPLAGLQHKYRETVLYFPQQGQTCHAFCGYCFRWPQFVGDPDLRFAADAPDDLVAYLRRRPDVSDVLVTGGDPMMMSTAVLRRHLEPMLGVDSIRTIRIGTKALAFWPHRFVDDHDADDLMRLIEQIRDTGRQVAVMHHVSLEREVLAPVAVRALARLRAAGATMFGQAPVMSGVNADAEQLVRTWAAEVAHGITPYYLFVARDTGAHPLYRIPLIRAHEVFAEAFRRLPGLARTVRGPVMSATPGKLLVEDADHDGGQVRFGLRFEQARDPRWVGRRLVAVGAPDATWVTDLAPAAGTDAELAGAVWRQPELALIR